MKLLHHWLSRKSSSCAQLIPRVILFTSVVLQTGCWGGGSDVEPEPEAEAKELKTEKAPLSTEVPEAELVKLSKKLYQVGMYTVARDSLASLKDRYPLGAYAGFAEVKHADSFFFNREYNEAAKAYENFMKNYPGSPDLPYVKLQAARAHIASARDAGRDRQPWERGLSIYDELVSSYVGSAYSHIARSERASVVQELASYDREIIEFYRREGNQAAVDAREKRFQERWQARLAGDDTESFKSQAIPHKPLKALDQVSVPPPITETTEEQPETSLAMRTEAPIEKDSAAPLLEGRIAIQSVQCRNEGVPFAIIELTRLPESLSERAEPAVIEPIAGQVLITGLGLTARQGSWNCFGAEDLLLTAEGAISIKTERSLSIAALNGPPRLLIAAGK